MIIRQHYINKIKPFIGTDLVKVLTGIRRCGKSVMLNQLMDTVRALGVSDENIVYINFENMSNSHLCTAEALHSEVMTVFENKSGKKYLFFDEIQEVENWEKAVNSFRVEIDCDIYITGSNAKLLSGELATYLSGRYVEFEIYPFSFSEFKELYTSIFSNVSISELFNKYMQLGGMPYLSNIMYSPEPSRQYLTDIYNSVILKDVVQRNNIRDIDMLERIIAYMTANIGTIFSATSISNYLKSEKRKVYAETVLNYIKACTDAFLFYKIRRQDLQGKKILTVNDKYYISDHGLREAVFGGNMRDINLTLENIVCIEALRRGYSVTVGKSGDKEIDFVCEKNNMTVYIQVTYLLASEDTVQREFGAYRGIKDNFTKYVVSMDEFDMSRDGIKHKNIRDFLLMEEWG